MKGKVGPWLLNTWMIGLISVKKPYAALHTGVPSPDDPTATEVVGAWYTRQAFVWDYLDKTSVANARPIEWLSFPSAVTLVGVGVYTTISGADLMLWCPLPAPVTPKGGGSFSIAVHDLMVQII